MPHSSNKFIITGLSNAEVRERLTNNSEYRMDLPLDIPPGIKKIIEGCWHEEPAKRPSFKEIHRLLINIFR